MKVIHIIVLTVLHYWRIGLNEKVGAGLRNWTYQDVQSGLHSDNSSRNDVTNDAPPPGAAENENDAHSLITPNTSQLTKYPHALRDARKSENVDDFGGDTSVVKGLNNADEKHSYRKAGARVDQQQTNEKGIPNLESSPVNKLKEPEGLKHGLGTEPSLEDDGLKKKEQRKHEREEEVGKEKQHGHQLKSLKEEEEWIAKQPSIQEDQNEEERKEERTEKEEKEEQGKEPDDASVQTSGQRVDTNSTWSTNETVHGVVDDNLTRDINGTVHDEKEPQRKSLYFSLEGHPQDTLGEMVELSSGRVEDRLVHFLKRWVKNSNVKRITRNRFRRQELQDDASHVTIFDEDIGLLPEKPALTTAGQPRWPVNESCNCKDCRVDRNLYIKEESGYEFENIAFGKPAYATVNEETPACAVTNGLAKSNQTQFNVRDKLICYYSGESVVLTQPWVLVDFQAIVAFREVLVKILFNELGLTGARDLSAYIDGSLCTKFYDVPQLSTGFVSMCTFIVSGRYFYIEKNKPTKEPLSVCEIIIWVCKTGWYGAYRTATCKRCPDDCDFPCHPREGCSSFNVWNSASTNKPAAKSEYDSSEQHSDQDGNTINNWFPAVPHFKTCMDMRNNDPNKPLWWRADMQGLFRITYFTLKSLFANWGRNYLYNFTVVVTHNTRQVPVAPTAGQVCLHVDASIAPGWSKGYTCQSSTPVYGRYAWIIAYNKLGLCKFKALGHPVYLLKPGSSCSPTSKWIFCAGGVCVNGTCKSVARGNCSTVSSCTEGLLCESGKCRKHLNNVCKPNECKRGTFCDTSINKCRLDYGESCQNQRDMCAPNAVCDSLNRCALKLNSTCEGTTPPCLSGAACNQGRCSCQEGTKFKDNQCKPIKLIGAACATSDDCDAGTCQNNYCACGGNQEVFAQDYTCRHKVGAACDDSSAETSCNTGAVCENNVCKLNLREDCEDNEAHCKTGLVCEKNKICKVDLNQDCANATDCVSGSICSARKCKIVQGGSCGGENDCASGTCSARDNNTCRIDVGQACNSDTAMFCRKGSVCEDDTVCKLNFNEPCSSTSQCQRGLQCNDRGTPLTKKCRMSKGRNCSQDDDCAEHSICDNQKQCRIAKDGNCVDNPTMCLNGASCSGGQCTCIQDVTDDTTVKCNAKEKIVGGSCDQSISTEERECLSQGAFCNAENTCQCRHSFVPDPSTLLCLAAPGFHCSSTYARCAHGLVCGIGTRTDQCVIPASGSCEGKSEHCRLETVCDDSDHTCRLTLHESCADNPTACRVGTTCDVLKRCKYRPGMLCRKDMDCVAGSRCKKTNQTSECQCVVGVSELLNGTCVPVNGIVGGQCEDSQCDDPLAECSPQGQCVCKEGYAEDPKQLSCAKAVGEPCSENEKCTSGLVCDPADSTCRVQVGQKCQKEMKGHCRKGSVCDLQYGSKCKLDLHEDCKGNNSIHCKSGTSCDVLEKCSVAVNKPCNNTESCVSGSTCTHSVCVCDRNVSTGVACQPLKGRLGSDCDQVLGCSINNAKCVSGVCLCVSSAVPQRDFSCARPSILNNGSILGSLIGGSIGVAVLVLSFAMIAWQVNNRRQKKKREDIVGERGANLKELQNLKSVVTETLLPEPKKIMKKSESPHVIEADRLSMASSASELESSMNDSDWDSSTVASGLESSAMTPGLESSIMAPGLESSVVAPGLKSSTVASGLKSSTMTPGLESSVVASGLESSITVPGDRSSVVDPGMRSITVLNLPVT